MKIQKEIKIENKIIDINQVEVVLNHIKNLKETYISKNDDNKKLVKIDELISLYDLNNNETKFDNYNKFLEYFKQNHRNIKTFDVKISFYFYEDSKKQHSEEYIYLGVGEKIFIFNIKCNKLSHELIELYDDIEKISQKLPGKFNEILKNRELIYNIVGFSNGLFIGNILSFIFLLIPVFRKTTFIFPIVSIGIMFILKNHISNKKLNSLYKTIEPNKVVFIKDDKINYKENLDNYFNFAEVLIGNNSDNLIKRNKIETVYAKSKINLYIQSCILILIIIISLLF